jgi:multicomponent Na+:H+ antiporter subunit C
VTGPTILGICAALLVGIGLYGLVANPHPLRKILAFNVVGSGVFLLLGVVARRGAGAGLGGDPVPQALLITGIVVAFSATALAVAVLLRLFEVTGSVTLAADTPPPVGPASAGHGGRLKSAPQIIVSASQRTAPGRSWCTKRVSPASAGRYGTRRPA